MKPLQPLIHKAAQAICFLIVTVSLGWYAGSPSNSSSLSMAAADWQIESVGEGSVIFDADGILLIPKSAIVPGETHASLLLSIKTLSQPLQNFEMKVTVTNLEQLRVGSPNPWEFFWVFFNYTLDNSGKKKTNYALVKPTGIEIGKAFNHDGQKFLLTQSTPSIQMGATYTLTIIKKGTRVTLLLDDKPAADYESTDAEKNIYDVPGAIGLYSEDARVRIRSVVLNALP